MSNYKNTFDPNGNNNSWNKAFTFVRKRSTVLDIGCSNGNFGAALQEYKNCIVDGIEPDPGDFKEATQRLRRVANAFAEEALLTIFKSQKYDHIVLLDVIEHLYDPVAVLKLIKTHLKPGGSIIFSIPNMAHISVRLMLLKGDFEYGETGLLDKTHLHFYTRGEIERVFAEAGFSVSKLDNTEATYPSALITDQLRDLGIKKSPKLEKLLNKDDARAFQYIGTAVVSESARKISRKVFSPDPQGSISLWFQKYIQEKDRALQELRNQLENQAKALEDQSKILENQKELARKIRISRYLMYYAQNKATIFKRYWKRKG